MNVTRTHLYAEDGVIMLRVVGQFMIRVPIAVFAHIWAPKVRESEEAVSEIWVEGGTVIIRH